MPAEPPNHCRLFTIGHSNHELSHWVALLTRHGVAAIADVRSQPYSQFSPQFNRDVLETVLGVNGIRYVFLGEELGARPSERECYVDGKARYDRIARLERFQRGLDRIRQRAICERLAMMCSEKDPLTCHRAILVCRRLRGQRLEIQHILEDGSLQSQQELEARMMKLHDLAAADLFRTPEELVESAYDLQADSIAYVDRPEGKNQKQLQGTP